jgi:aminocarboxymuconate-semialdehyde decarboxylase
MAIDVHAHFVPKTIVETLRDAGKDYGIDLVETEPGCHACRFAHGLQARPFFDGLMNVDLRLAEMEREGVARQILSLWGDVFGYGLPVDKGAAWHGLLNDGLARTADAHPDRFSWMASVPLQDGAAAARELERAAAAGAVGAVVAANVEGENLGECALDEFWSACVAFDMPVFVHPALPVAEGRNRRFGLNQIIGFTADTTYTVGSLILSGTLDRFPGLRLVLSHGGGQFVWLMGRFDRMKSHGAPNVTGGTCEHAPSAYCDRFWYDTILHDGRALRHLRDVVGIDRMVLGTDLPFPIGDDEPLATIRDAGFDEAERHAVCEANPRALYARLG